MVDIIEKIATALPSVDENQVLGELSDYRSKDNRFSRPAIWKTALNTTPCSWWNGTCGWTQLSKIAASILNLPPTSAAVERSFSRHSWIHSSKRNRLTTERASQLVFIAHNFALRELEEKKYTASFDHEDMSDVTDVTHVRPVSHDVTQAARATPARQEDTGNRSLRSGHSDVFESDEEYESETSMDISLHDSFDDEMVDIQQPSFDVDDDIAAV